jgi:hypothetical protein
VTPEFIASLKAMVLEAVERDAPPGGLGDDEPLFGPEARLDLDSLDALQVSMTIQQQLRRAHARQQGNAPRADLHRPSGGTPRAGGQSMSAAAPGVRP